MEQKKKRDERSSLSSTNSGTATLREHNAITKQRRARVSRACDECRARKTKCDGRQPCGNCEAFERYCSYHISQGRLGTAQRSKMLEDRLRRAHAHIRELQQQLPSSSHVDPDMLFGFPPEVKEQENEQNGEETDSSDDLDSMLDGVGRMTNSGHDPSAAFYGVGSGFAFLAKTREFFENSENESHGSERDRKSATLVQSAITKLFDAPFPDKQVLDLDVPVAHLLPSHESASELLRIVFDEAYPLFQFVDAQAFQEQIDRIYNLEPYDFEHDDHVFLPLFYVAMGLGMLFSRKVHRDLGCQRAVTQAMRYFIASRQMLDVTRCHHIASVQTLICFALFLISTARLATAHTYIALAISAALKMGLHCVISDEEPFTPQQADMRRRVFWTIAKLDIYISSCLGLPPMFNPLEADMTSHKMIDSIIAGVKDGTAHGSAEPYHTMCASRHLELMLVTAKMVKTLYQTQPESLPAKSRLRMLRISRTRLHEVEVELQEWRERTAELLEYENNMIKTTIIKYDLEISDAFARIILYRPFLHYLATDRQSTPPHEHQLRSALNCVQASQEVVHKSQIMLEQGYLGPASWHAMYTIFMAVVALIFYLATQNNNPEAVKVRYEIEVGVRILASTTCQDTGSEKCIDVLRALTERLSRRVNINIDEIRATANNSSIDAHARDPRELKNQESRRQIQLQLQEPSQIKSPKQFTQEQQQQQQQQQQGIEQQQMYSIENTPSQGKPSPYNNQQSPANQQQQQHAAVTQYKAEHPYMTASVFSNTNNVFQNMPGVTNTETDTSGAAQFHTLDAMQVPFVGTFGWPMSTNAGPDDSFTNPTVGGMGAVPSSTFPSSEFPVAFEDLDEFFFNGLNP